MDNDKSAVENNSSDAESPAGTGRENGAVAATISATVSASAVSSDNSPESKGVVNWLLILVSIIIFGIAGGLYFGGGKFLLQLKETEVSRGLITFLVAVITVSIALITAVWVLTSNAVGEELKERFSYSKDVLSTLVGILGTILGFYFASGASTGNNLLTGDMQIVNAKVITHVVGGAPPYRYFLNFGKEESTPLKLSIDGWISEDLPAQENRGDQIKIEIIDAKDNKVSVSKKYEDIK